jgi:hypothetical protein
MMKSIASRTLCPLLAAFFVLSPLAFALPSHSGHNPISPSQGPAGAVWKRFRYDADKFSVEFPAEPQAKATDSNTGTRYFTSLENDSFAYFVEKAELPADLKKTADEVFEGYVNGAAVGTNSKIKSQKPISLSGHPGREFVLESDTLVMQFRLYLLNKTLYQVLVVASKNMASRAEADRFLNSFEFLK